MFCGPKPKAQPTDQAPALRAVSTSTLLSPIITVFIGCCAGLFHERTEAEGIRLFLGEAVAAVDMEEIIGEAQPLADATRWTDRFVGEHGHGSLRAAGSVVKLVQSLERVEDSLIGVGEIKLVLAVVLQKKA